MPYTIEIDAAQKRIAILRRTPTPTLTFDALRAAASSKTDVRLFTELSAAEAWLAGLGSP